MHINESGDIEQDQVHQATGDELVARLSDYPLYGMRWLVLPEVPLEPGELKTPRIPTLQALIWSDQAQAKVWVDVPQEAI